MQNIRKQRSHSSNSITQEHSRLECGSQVQKDCLESCRSHNDQPMSQQQHIKRGTKNQMFWKRMRSLKIKHLCKMCCFDQFNLVKHQRVQSSKWSNWVALNIAIRYKITQPIFSSQNRNMQYNQQQSIEYSNNGQQLQNCWKNQKLIQKDKSEILSDLKYFDLHESNIKLSECSDYYKYCQYIPSIPEDISLKATNNFPNQETFIIVQQYMNIRKAIYYSSIRQILMKDMNLNLSDKFACDSNQQNSDNQQAFNYLLNSFSHQKQKESAIYSQSNDTIVLKQNIEKAGQRNWYPTNITKGSQINSARYGRQVQKKSESKIVQSLKKIQHNKQHQNNLCHKVSLKSIINKSQKIPKSKASEVQCKKNFESYKYDVNNHSSQKLKTKQTKLKQKRKSLKKFSNSCQNILRTNKKSENSISKSHKKTTQASQIIQKQSRYHEDQNQLGYYSESILKEYISELKQKIHRQKLNFHTSIELLQPNQYPVLMPATPIAKTVKNSRTQTCAMSKKKKRKKSNESKKNLTNTKTDNFYATNKQKFHESSQVPNHRKSNKKICITKFSKQQSSSTHKKQAAKNKCNKFGSNKKSAVVKISQI